MTDLVEAILTPKLGRDSAPQTIHNGSGNFMYRFITIAFMVMAQDLYATTFYLSSQNGHDNDSGTSEQNPWQSLNKINSTQFLPGDRILLSTGGVWDGQLNPQGSGNVGCPIFLGKYGNGPKPAIRGPARNHSAALLLENQQYWEIGDLDLSNWQPKDGTNTLYGILITCSNEASNLWHHIYIHDCDVHDVNSAPSGLKNYDKNTGGIIFNLNLEDALVQNCCVSNVDIEGIRTTSSPASSKVIFRGNLIENVYGDGIVLHGSKGGSVIERNKVYHSCMNDDQNRNWAAVWTYASTHTIVQFNEVYETTGGGMNDGEAFDADIDDSGDIFQYNYTHDNARGFMLFMQSAQDIIVRYNISQNDARGVAPRGGHRLFFQDGAKGSTSNQIYNNVFFVDGDLDCVFYDGFNVTFDNNIVCCRGRVAKFSTIQMSTASVFKNNCFFPPSLASVNGPAGTVADNIFADPEFTAPGSGLTGMKIEANGLVQNPDGYQLKANSPAIGKGLVIPENGGRDYYGHLLAGIRKPNIGVYQGKGLASLFGGATADAMSTNSLVK
jgi:hypothetical protein